MHRNPAEFLNGMAVAKYAGVDLSPVGLKGKIKVNYLKQVGLSLAMGALVFGASDLANAQGRRGRGEERSQENQAAREQRQQERQSRRQEQQTQQQSQQPQQQQQRWEQRRQEQQ